MNKQFFTAVVMSLSLVAGGAFAEGTPSAAQTELKQEKEKVLGAKEKLEADVKAGAAKEQVKADRKALNAARIAKRKAKVEVIKEKTEKLEPVK